MNQNLQNELQTLIAKRNKGVQDNERIAALKEIEALSAISEETRTPDQTARLAELLNTEEVEATIEDIASGDKSAPSPGLRASKEEVQMRFLPQAIVPKAVTKGPNKGTICVLQVTRKGLLADGTQGEVAGAVTFSAAQTANTFFQEAAAKAGLIGATKTTEPTTAQWEKFFANLSIQEDVFLGFDVNSAHEGKRQFIQLPYGKTEEQALINLDKAGFKGYGKGHIFTAKSIPGDAREGFGNIASPGGEMLYFAMVPRVGMGERLGTAHVILANQYRIAVNPAAAQVIAQAELKGMATVAELEITGAQMLKQQNNAMVSSFETMFGMFVRMGKTEEQAFELAFAKLGQR